MPLLGSEHINAIAHEVPTKGISVFRKRNLKMMQCPNIYCEFLSVKIVGLLNLESGLLIVAIVFVFSRKLLGFGQLGYFVRQILSSRC